MGKWLLFFLKFFLHQNHMIVNIIKLYGLPEKNHYTDPSALFSLLFFNRFSKVNLPWSDIGWIEDRNEKNRMNDCKHMNIICKWKQFRSFQILLNILHNWLTS